MMLKSGGNSQSFKKQEQIGFGNMQGQIKTGARSGLKPFGNYN